MSALERERTGAYRSPDPFFARLEALSKDPSIEGLRALVWDHYAARARSFPWRETRDPWLVLVSEVMLQQTQTDRIAKRYPGFIEHYPTPEALASASVEELLGDWKGLGYNRRGLNLKRAAQMIVDRHGGEVPQEDDALRSLPGVGPYTAAAVRAFAFGEPVVLIETNIRRLFLYVFFAGEDEVPDRPVLERIREALDESDPHAWYYALMDLGSAMRTWVPNPNRKSKHYAVQSRFEGSDRQIRGRIIEAMLSGARTLDELYALDFDNRRISAQVEALEREGFLVRQAQSVRFGPNRL